MPPEPRLVPRFAAEPPQELLPYGRWSDRLQAELLGACLRIDPGEGGALGDLGEIAWYPDRSWHGRTYVPATAMTSSGLEVFGYVSFVRSEDGDPTGFHATADATSETAEANPDWQVDLCDEVIGSWRGEEGKVAAMTLVWGRPLVAGSAIATAELTDLCVDQCIVQDDRFTLIAPDDYRGDTLEVRVYDKRGKELARESLYADDDEEPEEPDEARIPPPSGTAPPDGGRAGRPDAAHAQGVRARAGRRADARRALRPRALGAEPQPHKPVALSRPGLRRARAAQAGGGTRGGVEARPRADARRRVGGALG